MSHTPGIIAGSVLLLCAGGPVAGEDDDFEAYRRAVEEARSKRGSGQIGVREIERRPRVIEASNRIEEFLETTNVRTQRLSNLVMMDNTVGKVFPGALVWSRPIEDGRIHELDQVPGRPPVKVTVSGPLLEESSSEHSGSFSDFMRGITPVLQDIASTPVRLESSYRVSSSLEDALLTMGFSAKYWVVKVDSKLRQAGSRKQSHAVLSLDQVYYSVSADAAPLGGYLPDTLVAGTPGLASGLLDGMARGGEAAYVRKVDYGRRLIVVLSSSATVDELQRALKVTVDSVKASGEAGFDQQTKKVWESVEGQMILIGGRYPSGIDQLFSGSPTSFLNAVKAVMTKDNVIYSREEGAVPVSFELAYVSDGAPMQVYETVEFAGKIPVGSWSKRVESRTISTDGNDARVLNQDAEIDSDDWTKVELVSQQLRQSSDRRKVYFDLVWKAYEGDSGRRIVPRTIIESRKTFEFDFGRPLKPLAGRLQVGPREEWYADENHRHVSFPNHGFLSNVRVRFDGPGGNDDRLQSLSATLNIEVWMED